MFYDCKCNGCDKFVRMCINANYSSAPKDTAVFVVFCIMCNFYYRELFNVKFCLSSGLSLTECEGKTEWQLANRGLRETLPKMESAVCVFSYLWGGIKQCCYPTICPICLSVPCHWLKNRVVTLEH